ncbi:putative exonuclease I, partial [Serratia symbiotica str. Tucson]
VERVQKYLLQLEALYNQYASDKEKIALLHALFDYGRELAS